MNLWTFGCSFTNGQDSNGENYIQFEKSWPYLLSKKLNLVLENKGLIRSSNEMILDAVLHNQDKIRKNDLVVILMTYNSRFTRKQDELRGLTVSESDYKTLVRIIGDIDYMINLRTINTLLALNNLPFENKMISLSIVKVF